VSALKQQEVLRSSMARANAASEGFDFEYEDALATFWRQATPGTTYWRGYLPMLYLPGQVIQMDANTFSWDDETKTLSSPHQKGVAIWQFLGDDGRSRIALQLQRQGVKTIMEIDDNYLRYAPPLYGKHGAWAKTHREALESGNGYSTEMHRKVVPMMDALIVSTDDLANEYDSVHDNIHVCPNSVDPTDWNVERTESDVLRIGYYGSPSHMKDYPLAKKALKWAAMQDDVEVSMIGFAPPAFSGKVVPWNDDLFGGRAALGNIDVGIAPIKRNPWADGKSDVKAMEYAMAGVMPILHDAPPYSPWKDMGWEWMPSNEKEWDEAIRDIVSMRDEVKALAAAAKKYVLEYRTIQGNIGSWEAAIRG
jgi:hypothetical protein